MPLAGAAGTCIVSRLVNSLVTYRMGPELYAVDEVLRSSKDYAHNLQEVF